MIIFYPFYLVKLKLTMMKCDNKKELENLVLTVQKWYNSCVESALQFISNFLIF